MFAVAHELPVSFAQHIGIDPELPRDLRDRRSGRGRNGDRLAPIFFAAFSPSFRDAPLAPH